MPGNPPKKQIDLLSRFGLRNASEIKLYLSTPAGVTALTKLRLKHAEALALIEKAKLLQQRKQQRKQLIKLYRLLLEAYKHKRKEHESYEIDQELNDERLRQQKQKPDPRTLEQKRKNVKITVELVVKTLKEKKEELRLILVRLKQLDVRQEQLENHYEMLLTSITGLHNEVHASLNSEPALTHKKLVETTSYARIMLLLNSEQHKPIADALSREITLIHSNTCRLVNAEGQPASSYQDAHFLVPKDQQLICDPNGSYLLYPRTPIHGLSETERREQALRSFAANEPEMITQNRQLRLERTGNVNKLQQERAPLLEKRNQLQQEMGQLAQQLKQLRLEQETLNQTKPKPAETNVLSPMPDHKNTTSQQLELNPGSKKRPHDEDLEKEQNKRLRPNPLSMTPN